MSSFIDSAGVSISRIGLNISTTRLLYLVKLLSVARYVVELCDNIYGRKNDHPDPSSVEIGNGPSWLFVLTRSTYLLTYLPSFTSWVACNCEFDVRQRRYTLSCNFLCLSLFIQASMCPSVSFVPSQYLIPLSMWLMDCMFRRHCSQEQILYNEIGMRFHYSVFRTHLEPFTRQSTRKRLFFSHQQFFRTAVSYLNRRVSLSAGDRYNTSENRVSLLSSCLSRKTISLAFWSASNFTGRS